MKLVGSHWKDWEVSYRKGSGKLTAGVAGGLPGQAAEYGKVRESAHV